MFRNITKLDYSLKLESPAPSCDNAPNIDVAAKKLHFLKRGSFAHIFNPTAQKI